MDLDSPQLYRGFTEQAARTPRAIAIVDGRDAITYERLRARAQDLAQHLRSIGVGSRDAVAVHVPRSVDLMVGLLGALGAGATYVPLDPSLPPARLNDMLKASAPRALVNLQGPSTLHHRGATISLDELQVSQVRGDDGFQAARGQEVCCILFTSGSTGTPLAVRVSHRQAFSRLEWMWSRWPFEESDVALMHRSPTLIGSLWDNFGPLLRGITTVIVRQSGPQAVEAIWTAIVKHRITHLSASPTLLAALLDHSSSAPHEEIALRHCMVAGEPLSGLMVRRWRSRYPHATLLNVYGTTECNTPLAYDTSQWEGPDHASVPVGRPIAGAIVRLADAHGHAVPEGDVGEIVVGGDGVALGYLDQDTAEFQSASDRFVIDTVRWFKTGDFGRYRSDGTVEVIGRRDDLVKIRGFRVSVTEVERALCACSGVRLGAVIAQERAMGVQRLVAFAVSDRPALEIKEELKARVPGYMVPSTVTTVASLPVTASGKVDRQALKTLSGDARGLNVADRIGSSADADGDSTADSTERALRSLFEEVLGAGPIRVDQNFFELGGDSLSIITLLNRIRDLFDVELTEQDVFEHPCVSTLSARILRVLRAEIEDGRQWT